ncbi:hypothetical protein [Amycolatopsis taiwanensis]|nr:hypothetical protein [Amycolatopsis taiwanensis]
MCALAVEQDAAQLNLFDRLDLELALDLAVWLDMYSPTIEAA